MMKDFSNDEKSSPNQGSGDLTSRRSFLKWSSAAALVAVAYGALNPETLSAKNAFLGLPIDDDKSGIVDVGKGDIGVLNFVYANEQLEAAFYTQVIATPYSGMNAMRQANDFLEHHFLLFQA